MQSHGKYDQLYYNLLMSKIYNIHIFIDFDNMYLRHTNTCVYQS